VCWNRKKGEQPKNKGLHKKPNRGSRNKSEKRKKEKKGGGREVKKFSTCTKRKKEAGEGRGKGVKVSWGRRIGIGQREKM